MDIGYFLKLMVEKNASDMFLTTGAPVYIKIEGRLHPLGNPGLPPGMVKKIAYSLMDEGQVPIFERELELNTAQQAVVRATGADADQYAREQIELARQALSRAQSAMAQGDNDNARAYALAAAADADLARALSLEALATAQVAQRRAEVQRLRRELQLEDRR